MRFFPFLCIFEPIFGVSFFRSTLISYKSADTLSFSLERILPVSPEPGLSIHGSFVAYRARWHQSWIIFSQKPAINGKIENEVFFAFWAISSKSVMDLSHSATVIWKYTFPAIEWYPLHAPYLVPTSEQKSQSSSKGFSNSFKEKVWSGVTPDWIGIWRCPSHRYARKKPD